MISLAQLERGYREGCVGNATPDLIALNGYDSLGIHQMVFDENEEVAKPFWYKGVMVVANMEVPQGKMWLWGEYPSHAIAFGSMGWEDGIQWTPHLATVKFRRVEVKLDEV